MNTLLIVIVAVVGFCYFGGNKCPQVLKDNKEMLLGVLIGLALCSFMGVRLEGLTNCPANIENFTSNKDEDCPYNSLCYWKNYASAHGG